MSIDFLKYIWWTALVVSAQTWSAMLLAFALDFEHVRTTPKFDPALVHIFIGCIALNALAIYRLKALNTNTKKTMKPPGMKWFDAIEGRWQYSLGDLLVISFFAGACMALIRSISPDSFASGGWMLALFLTGEFAVAMLFAARLGKETAAERAFTALLMLMCAIIGTIVFWLIVALLLSPFLKVQRSSGTTVSPLTWLCDFVATRPWPCSRKLATTTANHVPPLRGKNG